MNQLRWNETGSRATNLQLYLKKKFKMKLLNSQKIRNILLVAAVSIFSVLSVAPTHAEAPDQQLNIFR